MFLFSNDFKVLIYVRCLNASGILISLLGIIYLIYSCKLISKSALLDYMGQNTLGLYFMSGALPVVLSIIINKVMPVVNLLGLTVVFISSTIIALSAVYLMNKYIPFIFDLRKLTQGI